MSIRGIENSLAKRNSLATLIQDPENLHVGYVIRMQYESVDILTNDFFKERAKGVPQNSFLLATAFDPTSFEKTKELDRVVLLLRVVGPSKLPQDDSNLITIIEHLQNKDEILKPDERDGIEPITHSLLQFGGLSCNILGSFYLDEAGRLQLGADIEDYQAAGHMRVYKPSNSALEKIVNYIDPIRSAKSVDDAKELGFSQMPEPFQIGTVRYTSSNRMQKASGISDVPLKIQPTDFLSRRTAVLGMTRTGKSNTIKTTVSSVALAGVSAHVPIGQLIFDMNGEYANANGQDDGSSIAEVFHDNVVRYRGYDTPGFFDLRDNFYQSLELGLSLLQYALAEYSGQTPGQDMLSLLNLSLEEPSEFREKNRWNVTVAIYKALLCEAGYKYSHQDDVVKFKVHDKVLEQIFNVLYAEQADENGEDVSNRTKKAAYVTRALGCPADGLSLQNAVEYFRAVRKANMALKTEGRDFGIESGSTKGKSWLSASDEGLLNLLVGKSDRDTPIRGARVIRNAGIDYHSLNGSDNIARDVYQHLLKGRIVILDLSVGSQKIRENLSLQIASYILNESSRRFTSPVENPPSLVIYVEEAHNLIGNKADFNTTWPRIAKEGAKAKISLVYATQEPSSVHTNILANTENFFVTHLNNEDELRALGKYYDFKDFHMSLKKAQDVGFARIKTLSSPFVVPSQILKFEPNSIRDKYESIPKQASFEPAPVPQNSVGGSADATQW